MQPASHNNLDLVFSLPTPSPQRPLESTPPSPTSRDVKRPPFRLLRLARATTTLGGVTRVSFLKRSKARRLPLARAGLPPSFSSLVRQAHQGAQGFRRHRADGTSKSRPVTVSAQLPPLFNLAPSLSASLCAPTERPRRRDRRLTVEEARVSGSSWPGLSALSIGYLQGAFHAASHPPIPGAGGRTRARLLTQSLELRTRFPAAHARSSLSIPSRRSTRQSLLAPLWARLSPAFHSSFSFLPGRNPGPS